MFRQGLVQLSLVDGKIIQPPVGTGFFILTIMATFRKVHVQFWGDPFIQDLTPEQKFFYLYLLTNGQTKQCGIYEITKRQICYDTGYNTDTVSKLLQYCIDTDKIKYNKDTNEIAIKNWLKYNGSDSPKVQSCINQELKGVKDTVLIEYIYGMDSVEILNRNKNKNKNKNKIQEEEKEGVKELKLPPPDLSKSNLYRQPSIPTKDKVLEVFLSNGGTKEMAKVFWDNNEGTGWFLKGSPITNFANLVPSFIQNWKKFEQKGGNWQKQKSHTSVPDSNDVYDNMV